MTIKIKADVVLVPQRSIVSEEDIDSDCTGCVFDMLPHMSFCHQATRITDCSVVNEDGENMVFTLKNANIKEKV